MTDAADARAADQPTSEPRRGLDELIAVMHRLRAECAWDQEQTHASLVPYLIEESAELVEAIEAGTPEDLREELGDVLYQVMFHSDIAAAEEGFDIQDVAAATAEKMRRRHPHVFGNSDARTPEEIEKVWAAVKAEEKSSRTSVLDGIPAGMPSLALAAKMLGRTGTEGVAPHEGTGSFEGEEGLGEVLLGIVAAARSQGLDAERALRARLRKLDSETRASGR
jgi:XTP/dITP diphosphohydrolase